MRVSRTQHSQMVIIETKRSFLSFNLHPVGQYERFALNRQKIQQQTERGVFYPASHLQLLDCKIYFLAQRVQYRRRELETFVLLQMFENELLMLEFGFSYSSTLHEHAADLHSVDTILESVDER